MAVTPLETTGRRMVFWGALLLMGWAVYELSIRVEEMVTWLSPVFSLVKDGKIILLDYFGRVQWHRLVTHLFLAACILFSLFALLLRNRLIPAILMVPLAILLALVSLGSTPLMSASLWQKLKLVPLALIAVGGALIFIPAIGRRKQTADIPPAPPPQQPYDPFHINRQ